VPAAGVPVAGVPVADDIDALLDLGEVAFLRQLQRIVVNKLLTGPPTGASALIGKLLDLHEARREAEQRGRGDMDADRTPRALALSLLQPARVTEWATLIGWCTADRDRLSALILECNARARARETADGAPWPDGAP